MSDVKKEMREMREYEKKRYEKKRYKKKKLDN